VDMIHCVQHDRIVFGNLVAFNDRGVHCIYLMYLIPLARRGYSKPSSVAANCHLSSLTSFGQGPRAATWN
jgi:hypothetical protein